MPSRTLLRLTPAVAIALAMLVWTSETAAQVRPPRTVLTIHWGPEDFPGTAVLDDSIRKALQRPPASPVQYFAEYLETERFPVESASLALRDYIHRKFEGRRIDLLTADSTPALQFALEHRLDLFPGVPIVFVAGSIPDLTIGRIPAGMTGVLSDVAFAETMELALDLHRSVRRVFVVAQAPTSERYDERVQAALNAFANRVTLTYIREPSLPGLLAAVKAVPADSVIFYTRYTPENAETIVYTDEVARLMAEVAPVPIYTVTDIYLGTGVVGGMMRGTRAVGTRVGEIARQVLEGTRPEEIPIRPAQLVPTFDWRQVRRWRIDPSRLPPGSDIQFQIRTPWESYRPYIIGTIIVIWAQLVLIGALLTQRTRRRRAEGAVLAREAALRTSYQRIKHLAGRLINEQEVARAALARDLHDGVCQELTGVRMGVGALKRSSGSLQAARNQRALSKVEDEILGVFEGIRRLSHDLHPDNLRLLGLASALKAHCAEVAEHHGVRVGFDVSGDLRDVASDAAVSLFRIAQEALRNAIVHGGARRLAVSLARTGAHIALTIADDGRGFDLEAVRRSGLGLGLVSMEERAHGIGGELQIVTGPAGTTVRVQIPAAAGEASSEVVLGDRRA